MATLYGTHRWRNYRSLVLADDAECAFARLAGNCRGALHVHHIHPVSQGGPEIPDEDGVVVLCNRHHALLHSWIRRQEPQYKTCPHNHRYAWAREQCERRLNAA